MDYDPILDPLYTAHYTIDDDLSFTISGRCTPPHLTTIYTILSLLTFGILPLLARWSPSLLMRLTTHASSLATADIMAITNQYDELSLHPIIQANFHAPHTLAFPTCGVEETLDLLRYFEYRYFRLLWNPVVGVFETNYAWKDPNWTSVQSVLDRDEDLSRLEPKRVMFGVNSMEILPLTDPQILLNEILHPFSVFQIASVILWMCDDYYYYAICILGITLFGVFMTLIEVKGNMQRMREMSTFNTTVKVFRHEWVEIASEEVVVGDILLVPDIIPCDCVLLDGDCIINESMLTGESLPISKYPIPSFELESLNLEAEEPASSAHMASYFLFAGTRVIRSRGILPLRM